MDRNSYITASEIGDFVYCKRGWWLKTRGMISTTYAMREGILRHDSLAVRLFRLKIIRTVLTWMGIIVLILILLLLLFM